MSQDNDENAPRAKEGGGFFRRLFGHGEPKASLRPQDDARSR